MPTNLRASVTADALGLTSGQDAPILVDGADTPILAAGLAGYIPTPGDRLLVTKVGGVLEVVQFLSVGNVPYTTTYRQATDPALTQTISEGAIWFDTSTTGGGKANRRESGVWVSVVLQASALNIPDVRKNAVELGYTMTSGGIAQLGNGIAAPTVAPTLSSYYPQVNSNFYGGTPPGSDVSAFFAGLETHPTDSTKWIGAAIFFGTAIRVLNKSDMQAAVFPDPSNGKPWVSQFYSWGGIARVGGTVFLLGSDNDRSTDVYIYAIDFATMNKIGETRLGGPTTFGSFHPRLVSNGSQIGFVWLPLSGTLTLRWLSPTTFTQIGSDITLKTGVGQQNIGDAFFGDAGDGVGANCLYVALETTGTNTNVMGWSLVSTTAALRTTGLDFPKANGKKIHAMSYDATTGHFVSLDNAGVAYTYSILGRAAASLSLQGRYTFYDSVTGVYPAGTFINGVDVSGTASTLHETGYSPTSTVSLVKRAWPRLQWATPPDTLDVDATHVDKANMAGIYTSLGGGTMWRAAYSTVGQVILDSFEVFPTTGTPDVHDFSTAAASLGKFQSAALRADGNPKTYFDGSGSARVDGLLPPGAVIMGAGTVVPAGWLDCDGSSLSTTTFADLFAAIGYTYGGAGASFNIPDMRHRYPAGFSSTLALGQNDGIASESTRTTNHTHDYSNATIVNTTAATGASARMNGAGTTGSSLTNTGGVAGTTFPHLTLHFLIKT